MSLHARIAIGSSRRVMLLERGVVVGGVVLVVATVAARLSSGWPIVLGLIGSMAYARWSSPNGRSKVAAEEFVIGERIAIEVHRSDARSVDHLVLDEETLLWPGLTVLHLAAAAFANGRRRTVIALDRELVPSDARALRRYLVWVSRGGVRPDPSNDRSS